MLFEIHLQSMSFIARASRSNPDRTARRGLALAAALLVGATLTGWAAPARGAGCEDDTEMLRLVSGLRARGTSASDALSDLVYARTPLADARRLLSEAGYSPSERGQALSDALGLEAAAFELAGAGFSPNEVYFEISAWSASTAEAAAAAAAALGTDEAEAIADAMLDDAAAEEDVALFLIGEGWSIGAILDFFEGRFGGMPDRLLGIYAKLLSRFQALLDAGSEWNAEYLREAMRVVVLRVRQHLNPAIDDAKRVGDWLRTVAGLGWRKAAVLLAGAAYRTEDIARWLREDVGVSASAIVELFRGKLAMTAARVITVLRAAGYTTKTTVAAVASAFGVTKAQLATALREAGVDAKEAFAAMVDHYGVAAHAAIQDAMVASGYALDQVRAAYEALAETMLQMNEMRLAASSLGR